MSDRWVLQELLGRRFGDSRDEDGEYAYSTLSLFDRAVKEGVATVPDPLGDWSRITHLHYRHMKGHWVWVLSRTRNSVCKTPRCKPVTVAHDPA